VANGGIPEGSRVGRVDRQWITPIADSPSALVIRYIRS
jgi:hypothetical protein